MPTKPTSSAISGGWWGELPWAMRGSLRGGWLGSEGEPEEVPATYSGHSDPDGGAGKLRLPAGRAGASVAARRSAVQELCPEVATARGEVRKALFDLVDEVVAERAREELLYVPGVLEAAGVEFE